MRESETEAVEVPGEPERNPPEFRTPDDPEPNHGRSDAPEGEKGDGGFGGDVRVSFLAVVGEVFSDTPEDVDDYIEKNKPLLSDLPEDEKRALWDRLSRHKYLQAKRG